MSLVYNMTTEIQQVVFIPNVQKLFRACKIVRDIRKDLKKGNWDAVKKEIQGATAQVKGLCRLDIVNNELGFVQDEVTNMEYMNSLQESLRKVIALQGYRPSPAASASGKQSKKNNELFKELNETIGYGRSMRRRSVAVEQLIQSAETISQSQERVLSMPELEEVQASLSRNSISIHKSKNQFTPEIYSLLFTAKQIDRFKQAQHDGRMDVMEVVLNELLQGEYAKAAMGEIIACKNIFVNTRVQSQILSALMKGRSSCIRLLISS